MKEIVANPQMVSYCGLYCGACGQYLRGKCPGCREKTNAQWCKIRTCNQEAGTFSCADCTQVSLDDCRKLNNPIAKIFSFVFRSDRKASLNMIRERGADGFALEMTRLKQQCIKRGQQLN